MTSTAICNRLPSRRHIEVCRAGVLMSVHRAVEPSHLRRALDSVLHQRVPDHTEIRIYLGIDGAIPPALNQVVRDFEARIYKIIRFSENRGLGCVLTDLIQSREDEMFFFRMDADDVSYPQRFRRQIEYMRRHPDIDILGTDIMEVDWTSGRREIVHFADDHEDARRKIAWRVPVAHPTVCFRATVFDRVPCYPAARLNEDVGMWFTCLQSGLRFGNVPEPLYEFTITEQFWQRRGPRKAWHEFMARIRGLLALEGLDWRYILPAARLVLRLLPIRLQKLAYQSRLRKA